MVRTFASGLAGNGLFVASGLLKQYLIASLLSVAEFGAYGTYVAIASFMFMAIPFPAYINIMLRGFSAPASAFGSRKRLIVAARLELLALVLIAVVACLLLGVYWIVVGPPDKRAWPLMLLLLAQYANACIDLLLRMQQAHGQLAMFMSLRNLPAVLLLLALGASSPLQVAAIDFVTAAAVCLYFLRSPALRVRPVWRLRPPRWHLQSEQTTLWLARVAQIGNSSLLRLAVPIVFAAHERGLFFFALIAQLPCSLFLAVATQMFGHTLARVKRGDWRTFLRTQGWYAVPNIGYVLAVLVLMPYWPLAMRHLPSLAKYADAGPLVVAIVVYSAVLASDCQEFLLRTRGLSRILLLFSVTSALVQIGAIVFAWTRELPLVSTIYLCTAVQAATLAAFSTYSARRVVGPLKLESAS